LDYKAISNSFGFRGQYWKEGEIAKNVTPEEKIPHHFEKIGVKKSEPQTNQAINPLSKLTNTELKKMADEKGIEYQSTIKKDALIELIIAQSGANQNPFLDLTIDELKELAEDKGIDFAPEIEKEALVDLIINS
jgi:hypothetical protein